MAQDSESTDRDSTEPSFVCREPQCNRQFSSSTALARHSKNHSDECTHICPICDVGFFRHDLLTRHMKLHTKREQRSAPAHANRRIRTRCHTACDRCRDSKKRCDGQQPCAACQAAKKPCKFDSSSHRISRVLNRERRPSSAEFLGAVDGATLENVESNSSTAWSQEDSGHGVIPVSMDISPGMEELPSECSSTMEGRQIAPDNPALDLLSWPWLHQNAFLTEDTNKAINSIICADIGLPVDLYQDALGGENCQLGTGPGPCGSLEDGSRLQPTHSDLGHAPEPSTNGQARAEVPSTAVVDYEIMKHQVIDEVVRSALLEAKAPPGLDRALFWDSVSRRISQAFRLETSEPKGMNRFLQLYLDHFHPLWPLFSRQNLELSELHPYLYLVLSCIGAMYGSSLAKEYGSMMHMALCTYLCSPLELELEDDGNDLIWLAQARLLTQVAALYFGHVKAFSISQHLGVLLITQARKISLFSAPFYRNGMALFQRMKHVYPDSERLSLWLSIESRRRLAFGIFRGDTFISVVLNTKPLVSLEEIDLDFPTSQIAWAGDKIDARQALDIIDRDREPSTPLSASEIYHVALDRGEILPPLKPLAHELLLFGLQWHMWRFSHDRDLFERLTGRQGNEDLCQIPYQQDALAYDRRRLKLSALETESPDTLSRRMTDLVADRERLLSALGKWEQALPIVKNFSRSEPDRSVILSSLIMYHVGYMRLLAPIEEVHQIQYHLMNRRPVDITMVRKIQDWATSPEATTAMSRVVSVWSLLDKESRRAPNNRPKVNILAFIGLHHGVALLWAFIGCRKDKTDWEWLLEFGFVDSFSSSVHEGHGESGLCRPFTDLYDRINPAGWSSFAEATKVLAANDFPEAISLDPAMYG